MPRLFFVCACLVCLAAFAGCGDDDGGGDTTVTTGLPRSDELSSLNDEDAEQACVSTARSFNDVLADSELERISCIIAAMSILLEEETEGGSDAVEECDGIVDDCLKGEINGQPIGDIDIRVVDEAMCSGARASATFAECEATVGDYEDCAAEVKGQLRSQLRALSCDALRDVEEAQAKLMPQVDNSKAPKCEALADECPMVDFSGEG